MKVNKEKKEEFITVTKVRPLGGGRKGQRVGFVLFSRLKRISREGGREGTCRKHNGRQDGASWEKL